MCQHLALLFSKPSTILRRLTAAGQACRFPVAGSAAVFAYATIFFSFQGARRGGHLGSDSARLLPSYLADHPADGLPHAGRSIGRLLDGRPLRGSQCRCSSEQSAMMMAESTSVHWETGSVAARSLDVCLGLSPLRLSG